MFPLPFFSLKLFFPYKSSLLTLNYDAKIIKALDLRSTSKSPGSGDGDVRARDKHKGLMLKAH